MKLRMLYGQLVLEMKLFFRDRAAVFWTFFFPVLLITIFGMVFGGKDGININLAIVDLDQSTYSSQLIETLKSVPVLKITESDSSTDIRGEIANNKQNVAVIIETGYEKNIASSGDAELKILYDLTQQQTFRMVNAILSQIITEMNWKLTGTKPVISLKTESIQPLRRDQNYIDFLLPGVIAMSVVSTCLFSIGMVLVVYKKEGKLRRLSVTPLPKSIFIAGQMINRYIIVLMQAGLLLGLGLLVFKVQITGSLFYYWIVLTVGMLAFIALGLTLASTTKNSEAYAGLSNAVFMPMIFLSGVYFPVNNVPVWLKAIIEFLPLTHLIRASRAIMNNGSGFTDVLPQMGILSIWILLCFTLAARFFKWE